MKRRRLCLLLAAAAFAGVSTPALAQMDHSMMPGMKMPGMKMPAKKKPAAKKPATKKPPAKKSTKAPGKKTGAAKKATTSKAAAKNVTPKAKTGKKGASDPHAGHDMSNMPGMDMPAGQAGSAGQPMPEMPGHDMSNMPGMTMPGHDMSAMPAMDAPAGTDLPAGNAPAPPPPTDHAADRVYGPASMAMGRHHLGEFHGNQKLVRVLGNIAEYQARKGRDGYEWDAEGWYGGDINRLWVKSEGEGAFGERLEKAEVQALYSHAIDPSFNLQGGIRYDFKPNPSRVYATVGFEGLAPSFFDVEGALFLSNKGELMARAEGYYDQRITQRLILQPRAELNFAAQNSREIGVGAGLSDAEIGLRLRYDIRREFAPYVGVQYRRAFGRTRDYLRAEGEASAGWSFLAGVRTWF